LLQRETWALKVHPQIGFCLPMRMSDFHPRISRASKMPVDALYGPKLSLFDHIRYYQNFSRRLKANLETLRAQYFRNSSCNLLG
jgi:hypothetical protein